MIPFLLALAISNPWSLVTLPASGHPDPIGSYSAGCLQGGQQMALQGSGYQLLRPEQRRYFGHPELIRYLHDLIQQSRTQGIPPLLIGDMAMVRGGPFTSGHRSHQNGLDVDIWFRFGTPVLSRAQLANPTPVDMVQTDNRHVSGNFTSKHRTLLRLAASDNRVERIFVHPAIKLALCEQTTGDRRWLHKIRPWFGHRAHFHIRLRCPAGAHDCTAQKPIPSGDGCEAELISWFAGPTEVTSSSKPKPLPALPARCDQILSMHH